MQGKITRTGENKSALLLQKSLDLLSFCFMQFMFSGVFQVEKDSLFYHLLLFSEGSLRRLIKNKVLKSLLNLDKTFLSVIPFYILRLSFLSFSHLPFFPLFSYLFPFSFHTLIVSLFPSLLPFLPPLLVSLLLMLL